MAQDAGIPRPSSVASSPLKRPPLRPRLRPDSRYASRGSSYGPSSRLPSEYSYRFSRESQVLSESPIRGSMILYRLADDEAERRSSAVLSPPRTLAAGSRDKVASFSFIATLPDSKYPSDLPSNRGLVPYAYDPAPKELDEPDDEDFLHDPSYKGYAQHRTSFPWRGIANIGLLLILIFALLALFVGSSVILVIREATYIDGNMRVNATGQVPVPVIPNTPALVDEATPQDARTRKGFDGESYSLVFSDEFELDGRTFYPGDDPFWEAADLWWSGTADLEWYDPSQIVTRDGHLVITMDSMVTTKPRQTPGSTAPFTAEQNHQLTYRSGMLQSWNKFCFTRGYVEVAVVLPGPDENAQGYWPAVWTMGNLARPGYAATANGAWPYTYSSCDVGTFPNQTNADKLGPAAALHTDKGQDEYNFELSWLPGQKLSACSCPGSDHPGPDVSVGRGAPEIDVLEAAKDTAAPRGQVVSQSAQFAPFTHNYNYVNTTADDYSILNPAAARPNSWKGSAIQQTVSSLVKLPPTGFQGSGKDFVTYGFEYWSDPKKADSGFITWQVNGTASSRMGAGAVGPDQGPNGSGVGQRLIPVEPMSIVLNLGLSGSWQRILTETMVFPAEMLIDYVRVYQRDGEENVGCDPPDYPTMDYINQHYSAYSDPNVTQWGWELPKNSLYSGGC